MTVARRYLNPYGMEYSLAFLEPPAKTLTPERAERWLSRDFKWWSALANQGYARGVPARLRDAAAMVAADTRVMVMACTEALSAGRAVQVENLADVVPSDRDTSYRLEYLRRIAELEKRSAQGPWKADQERFDTRMRRTVERSIRAMERRLAKLREEAARDAA